MWATLACVWCACVCTCLGVCMCGWVGVWVCACLRTSVYICQVKVYACGSCNVYEFCKLYEESAV